MKIILEATVESIRTRQDNTISVTIGTQEADASTAGNLFQLRNKICKVLISDSNITDIETVLVDEQKITTTKKKSPSQRLRAVLYRYWEQVQSNVDFDRYYETKLTEITEHYRSKLDQI